MSTVLTPAATAPPTRATRREWLCLAAIALPCAVYAMDLTVLNLALPAIAAQLKPTASQLLWTIDIYGFMVAGLLITMGTLGDRIGRRRMLLIGAALFAAASTIAAFATSVEMLIVMRALLGVAGATIAPSTMSLIRNMFHDEHERQFAIGVWIASYSLGATIGPLVGGVLLAFFPWGAVFLAAVPVMLLLLLVGPWLLPEYRDPNAGQVDLPSVALSLAAVLAVIYGIKQLAEFGVSAWPVLIAGAGLMLGGLFARRQRRLAYPLLDLALFRNPAFNAAIAAYAASSVAMFGVYIFITQYLQGVLGLAPLAAGVATLPWSLAFAGGSLATPALARRFGKLPLLIGGQWVAAVGLLMLAAVDVPAPIGQTGPLGPWSGLPMLVASTLVTSLGMAPVITIGNELMITAAPPQRAGAASALAETSAEFSGALGIAVFGSLGSMLFARALAAAMAPGGTAAGAADLAGRSDLATLGGALAAAAAQAGPHGDALGAAARTAFVSGLQAAALAAAAVVALVAWVSARRLRGAA